MVGTLYFRKLRYWSRNMDFQTLWVNYLQQNSLSRFSLQWKNPHYQKAPLEVKYNRNYQSVFRKITNEKVQREIQFSEQANKTQFQPLSFLTVTFFSLWQRALHASVVRSKKYYLPRKTMFIYFNIWLSDFSFGKCTGYIVQSGSILVLLQHLKYLSNADIILCIHSRLFVIKVKFSQKTLVKYRQKTIRKRKIQQTSVCALLLFLIYVHVLHTTDPQSYALVN